MARCPIASTTPRNDDHQRADSDLVMAPPYNTPLTTVSASRSLRRGTPGRPALAYKGGSEVAKTTSLAEEAAAAYKEGQCIFACRLIETSKGTSFLTGKPHPDVLRVLAEEIQAIEAVGWRLEHTGFANVYVFRRI